MANMFVTPKDIDETMNRISYTLSRGHQLSLPQHLRHIQFIDEYNVLVENKLEKPKRFRKRWFMRDQKHFLIRFHIRSCLVGHCSVSGKYSSKRVQPVY